MDPDQTVDAQVAQACLPEPLVSVAPGPADAPVVLAPGPSDGGGENPVLASHEPKVEGGEPKSEAEEAAERKELRETVTGVVGAAHGAADIHEGLEASHEVIESAKTMQNIEKVAPSTYGLSAAQEAAAAGKPGWSATVEEASHGARSAAENGKVGLGTALAPIALGLEGYELYEAGKDINKNGLNLDNGYSAAKAGIGVTSAGIGTVQAGGTLAYALGAEGAGASMTGAAAAAAPAGMVLGAAAGGLAVGDLMAKAADSKYAGGWGEDGKMTAMQRGAAWGSDYDKELVAKGEMKQGDWSWGGMGRAALGGIGMGVVGAGQAAKNWLLGSNAVPGGDGGAHGASGAGPVDNGAGGAAGY